MDDPWGSPWANESPKALSTTGTIELQRQAPSSSTLPLGHAKKSPWEINDSPEGWTPLATTNDVGVYGPTVLGDLAVETWNSPGDDEPAPQKDETKKTTKSTWFSRATRPQRPDNEGLKSPKAVSRQLSPDPWATEADRIKSLEAESSVAIEGHFESTSPSAKAAAAIPVNAVTGFVLEKLDTEELSHIPHKVSEAGGPGITDVPAISIGNDAVEGPSEVQASVEEHPSSRPSSSPSDASHFNEIIPESPRTSFEDEAKHSKFGEEGPPKVKDLVTPYDGTGVEMLNCQKYTPSNDSHVSMQAGEEPEEDFGDFEEGISCTSTKCLSLEDTSTCDTAQVSIFHSVTQDATNDSARTYKIPRDHGPVQFDMDISLLNQIFGDNSPGSNYASSSSNMTLEIDNIILDSFYSTEQRKAWYRVSRYGTMKKHNTDEENYIRVDWPHSEIRAKTLKIVGRWMEERHLGGATILGSSNRIGYLFGWGQANRAPVFSTPTLEAEAKSRNRPGPQKTSAQSPINATPAGNHIRRVSLGSVSASKSPMRDSPIAASPQFSWSSSQPVVTSRDSKGSSLFESKPRSTSDQHSCKPLSAQRPRTPEICQATHESNAIPTKPISLTQPPALSVQTDPAPRIATQGVLNCAISPDASIGNDEWGDTISSPAIGPTSRPPLAMLSYKPSENLMSNLNPISINHIESLGAGHKPSNSMDSGLLRSGIARGSSTTYPHPPEQNFLSMTSIFPAADPWATADFSFFDSPDLAALPKPQAAASQFQTPSWTPLQTTPVRPEAPEPVPSQPQLQQKYKETEQERIVKSIVQSLPDLSYMLRH